MLDQLGSELIHQMLSIVSSPWLFYEEVSDWGPGWVQKEARIKNDILGQKWRLHYKFMYIRWILYEIIQKIEPKGTQSWNHYIYNGD